MEIVSFISIEDDPPDLILSFALWQADIDDIRSLIPPCCGKLMEALD